MGYETKATTNNGNIIDNTLNVDDNNGSWNIGDDSFNEHCFTNKSSDDDVDSEPDDRNNSSNIVDINFDIINSRSNDKDVSDINDNTKSSTHDI